MRKSAKSASGQSRTCSYLAHSASCICADSELGRKSVLLLPEQLDIQVVTRESAFVESM